MIISCRGLVSTKSLLAWEFEEIKVKDIKTHKTTRQKTEQYWEGIAVITEITCVYFSTDFIPSVKGEEGSKQKTLLT